MGCNFVSAKTITSGKSKYLAKHVIEMTSNSGFPPFLLITDTARNEKFGAMKEQVEGINNMINEINKKRIDHHRERKDHGEEAKREVEENENKETIDNIGEHRKKELQKYKNYTYGDETGPLLRRPVRVHQPTANNSSHPRQATSLGTVDATCKALKRYIEHHIMNLEAPCNQEELDLMIASFEIHNNIYKPSYKTKKPPVLIHYQPTRGEDKRSWTEDLATSKNQEEAKQLSTQQRAAKMAKDYKEAEENRSDQDGKDKERWKTKTHPGAMDIEKVIETYQPLAIVSVETDDQDRKMAQKYGTTAPWMVLHPIIDAPEEIFMMHLLTGEVATKQIRNTMKIIPTADILGSSIIWEYMRTSRRMEVTDRANYKEMSAKESLDYLDKIVHNIMQAFKFLAPLMPTGEETKQIARELHEVTKTETTEGDSDEEEWTDDDDEQQVKQEKQVKFDEPHKAYEGKPDPEDQAILGRGGPAIEKEDEDSQEEPEEEEERKERTNKEKDDETTLPRRSRRDRKRPERYQDDWRQRK